VFEKALARDRTDDVARKGIARAREALGLAPLAATEAITRTTNRTTTT